MARPRRGKRRRGDSSDWITNYLLTGIEPADHPEINPFEALDIFYDDAIQRAAWEEHRHAIMTAWRKPGCRPFAWWQHDAPKEPRRHLSGPGVPRHERLAYTPDQHFGIPIWFGDPDNPPIFETQFAYLERHGLLEPGEDQPPLEPHPHPAHIEDAAAWDARRTQNE